MENTTDDVIIEPTDDVTVDTDQTDSFTEPTTDVLKDMDENGVSYKNRFMEVNRKYENLSKSLPDMIKEGVSEALQSTQVNQKQEYSIEDYRSAMMKDPDNAGYYQAQIDTLREQNIQKSIKDGLSSFQREQETKVAQTQAEAWAFNNFPQLKDPNNEFSRQVWQLFNSRPSNKREPYDFAVATELVAGRLGIKPSTQNELKEKVTKQDRELSKLKKERVLEGDGQVGVNVAQATQKQADLQDALSKGNVSSYFQKYYIKPIED